MDVPVTKPTPAAMVEEFVKLRSAKQLATKRFEELVKERYGDRMDELNDMMLDLLNQMGSDSVRSPAGTFYKLKTVSLTVADQREFRRHIIGGELWDMIEWRPLKTAIDELLEGGEALPPGLNRSVFTKVGVRKNT